MFGRLDCSVSPLAWLDMRNPFEFEIYAELDSVTSRSLATRKTLSSLLRFLVEQTLENGGCHLKEFTVATMVFNRDVRFDPRFSSLVRTQVSKLRHLLCVHYAKHPKVSAPWIWVHPGSYRVVFDQDPFLVSGGRVTSRPSRGVLAGSLGVSQVRSRVLSPKDEIHRLAETAFRVLETVLNDGRVPGNDAVSVLVPASMQRVGVSSRLTHLAVEQTILETNGTLLLTISLLDDSYRYVMYANSVAAPWEDDETKAIMQFSALVDSFAAHCFSFLH
jgi:hypothetical protein